MEIEEITLWPQLAKEFDFMLKNMEQDLANYKLKENASPEYIAHSRNIIETCKAYRAASNVIIKQRGTVIIYTSETLRDERAHLYRDLQKNKAAEDSRASILFQENQALKRTINLLRGLW